MIDVMSRHRTPSQARAATRPMTASASPATTSPTRTLLSCQYVLSVAKGHFVLVVKVLGEFPIDSLYYSAACLHHIKLDDTLLLCPASDNDSRMITANPTALLERLVALAAPSPQIVSAIQASSS